MKRGILILVAAMMAGILAFFLSRGESSPDTNSVLLDCLPELTWLRTDLKLTNDQFSKVEQLHREYRPVCAEMCRSIAHSEAEVARLASAKSGMSDELSNAIETHGRVIPNPVPNPILLIPVSFRGKNSDEWVTRSSSITKDKRSNSVAILVFPNSKRILRKNRFSLSMLNTPEPYLNASPDSAKAHQLLSHVYLQS